MLEANCNKGGNGEPDTNELANKVVGCSGKEDSNADHPVAQNCLDNGLANGATALVESSRRTKAGSSGVGEEASVPSSESEKTAPNDITDDRDDKALGELSPSNHILEFRGSNSGRVASKELQKRRRKRDESDTCPSKSKS